MRSDKNENEATMMALKPVYKKIVLRGSLKIQA